jgi:hypothetical protein
MVVNRRSSNCAPLPKVALHLASLSKRSSSDNGLTG